MNEDPRGKNRVWLQEDKFIRLFDGRLVKRTFQDVLTEAPLKKGVRKTIDKYLGPFEGNWQPEVTPKEQLYLEKRSMVTPNQSDLQERVRNQVEKEVEWHMYK